MAGAPGLGSTVTKLTGELGGGTGAGAASLPEAGSAINTVTESIGGGLGKPSGFGGATYTTTPVSEMSGMGAVIGEVNTIQLASSLPGMAVNGASALTGSSNSSGFAGIGGSGGSGGSSGRDVNAEMQKEYDAKQAQQARDNDARQAQARQQQDNTPRPPSFIDC